jgi:tetratricopeptide (TPR) repeat protein
MREIASRRSWVAAAVGAVIVAAAAAVEAAGGAPPSGAPALRPEEAREICLAEAAGATSFEQQIRSAQEAARKLSAKPERWTAVGWGWVRKARVSTDPGFYLNVQACADAALQLAPDDAPALQLHGLALMNGHRFAEARDVAQTILAKSPRDPIALGTLSDALLELGSVEDAVAAAQRGADVRPDSAAYARASYFRWLHGDRGGAKRFIRAALGGRDRRDPEPTAWAFVEAAKIFWNEADYGGADAVLEEALRWVPGYAPALVARGRVALSRAQPALAIELLEQAYRAQPLPETAWLLEDARAMAGDAAGAEAESARVVQAGKRSDRLTLALYYATKDRAHDEALRLIEEERATRGGVYVDDAYAWALYRAGRLDEARRASDRALRLGTPDARLLYHAGAIRIAAGVPGGRALVEKAVALNPAFDATGAAEARALLAAPGAATKPRAGVTESRRTRRENGAAG